MTNSQDLTVKVPVSPIEIDQHIYDLQTKLSFKLNWLTHDYGRAYRNIQLKDGSRMYYPEIYRGVFKNTPSYLPANPDNDKKGICFFVVGPEVIPDFKPNTQNFIEHSVGIVFWVNLKLIDPVLLDTELFTQHLIRDVRNVLTNNMIGTKYRITIKEVVREFNEVYKEYVLEESENYLKAPYQAFRFNVQLSYLEGCGTVFGNSCDAILKNITEQEKVQCILPTIDFSNPENFGALTPQQLIDIQNQIPT